MSMKLIWPLSSLNMDLNISCETSNNFLFLLVKFHCSVLVILKVYYKSHVVTDQQSLFEQNLSSENVPLGRNITTLLFSVDAKYM